MYWLLDQMDQANTRAKIDTLVEALSTITGNPQTDQIFPFVGRKDRRKAIACINTLTSSGETVVDPFAGSGSFVYASFEARRHCEANEWEPYTCRMASAPWRLPDEGEVNQAKDILINKVKGFFDYLYRTRCTCGNIHVIDSLFFDRIPLEYTRITKHERLGDKGENITYRGQYKCPFCGCTEKHFDEYDQKHLGEISKIKLPNKYEAIFNTALIENSRINLSKGFTLYKSLFPYRSLLGLSALWEEISLLNCDTITRVFLEDAFLSILPQAKYKDYRSKSQDLHVPEKQLREVNILYRFTAQIERRYQVISRYAFASHDNSIPIKCKDFRIFLKGIESGNIDFVLTDPPWTDGNAYFEKAQLYHPWLNYNLSKDAERLENEFVVTDAPSRKVVHNIPRWWQDVSSLFNESYRILKPNKYLALFFRPIPASKWLTNLNALKLVARKNGFEPLLSIDVGNSDPSMRIQQSASYVFSDDIVFVFLKLPENIRRVYCGDVDVDQLTFQTAEELQEEQKGPFSYQQWRDKIAQRFILEKIGNMNLPKREGTLHNLFRRYCDEVSTGFYLPKPLTPFSGQLFDIPSIERLFTYVPQVINELTKGEQQFTFDRFLLRLAEYVENGTRMLIDEIEQLDIKKIIKPYVTVAPGGDGRWFVKRSLPTLPRGLRNVLELDPYEFESFIAHLLEKQGFTSIATIGRSGDRGVDVTANDPNGVPTVVQCKRYINHKVSSTPVQRLHSFAVTRGAKRKILITTSDFTKQAIEEAKHTKSELICGTKLENIITKYLPEYI